MRRRLLVVPISAALIVGLAPELPAVTSQISSNFNGTAIAAGNYIWFNSVFDYTGPTTGPVTIVLQNSIIEFTANSVPYTLSVPDASITLSSSFIQATTTFDTPNNRWVTTAPFGLSGNLFLSGLPFQVPVNFPGGINPVKWTGNFFATIPTACLSWKWAAAVYTSFNADPEALGVKPTDANHSNPYLNSDHAGTPENFKSFVTGGARGGGGSNFTGSYSGTASLCLDVVAVEQTVWGAVKNLYRSSNP